jgi:two-component system response regulator MprA
MQPAQEKGPVMLIEDDPDIRAMISQLLELEGYRVVISPNGIEALTQLRGGLRPSVILLDLMMPVMNGWQFRAEQAKDDQLARIPVVIISGDGRVTERNPQVDADGFLRKPIDLDVLLSTVARFAGAPAAASP